MTLIGKNFFYIPIFFLFRIIYISLTLHLKAIWRLLIMFALIKILSSESLHKSGDPLSQRGSCWPSGRQWRPVERVGLLSF